MAFGHLHLDKPVLAMGPQENRSSFCGKKGLMIIKILTMLLVFIICPPLLLIWIACWTDKLLHISRALAYVRYYWLRLLQRFAGDRFARIDEIFTTEFMDYFTTLGYYSLGAYVVCGIISNVSQGVHVSYIVVTLFIRLI
jgi:hypothetical protein